MKLLRILLVPTSEIKPSEHFDYRLRPCGENLVKQCLDSWRRNSDRIHVLF